MTRFAGQNKKHIDPRYFLTENAEASETEEPSMGSTTSAFNVALDIAGLIPGYGEIADLANTIDYARKGDYLFAALSLVSVIPALGDLVGKGGKIGVLLSKTGSLVRKLKVLLSSNRMLIDSLFDKAEQHENLKEHVPKMREAVSIFSKDRKNNTTNDNAKEPEETTDSSSVEDLAEGLVDRMTPAMKQLFENWRDYLILEATGDQKDSAIGPDGEEEDLLTEGKEEFPYTIYMFYIAGCGACKSAHNKYLIPFSQKYGFKYKKQLVDFEVEGQVNQYSGPRKAARFLAANRPRGTMNFPIYAVKGPDGIKSFWQWKWPGLSHLLDVQRLGKSSTAKKILKAVEQDKQREQRYLGKPGSLKRFEQEFLLEHLQVAPLLFAAKNGRFYQEDKGGPQEDWKPTPYDFSKYKFEPPASVQQEPKTKHPAQQQRKTPRYVGAVSAAPKGAKQVEFDPKTGKMTVGGKETRRDNRGAWKSAEMPEVSPKMDKWKSAEMTSGDTELEKSKKDKRKR